jgi:hypothetical protein
MMTAAASTQNIYIIVYEVRCLDHANSFEFQNTE